MKTIIGLMMLLAMSVPIVASAGEDLFPWPWGTECPFPWREIEGQYVVNSPVGGVFDSHFMNFNVSKDDGSGLKFLKITQYDHRGEVYATGRGYSQKDQRIVRGVLRAKATGREYTVVVRSYMKDKGRSCTASSDMVTAISFCSLRSSKNCLADSNYLLEKVSRP